jgi:hypothetical protein
MWAITNEAGRKIVNHGHLALPYTSVNLKENIKCVPTGRDGYHGRHRTAKVKSRQRPGEIQKHWTLDFLWQNNREGKNLPQLCCNQKREKKKKKPQQVP